MTRAHEEKAAKQPQKGYTRAHPNHPIGNAWIPTFMDSTSWSRYPGWWDQNLTFPSPRAQWYLKFLVSVKTPSFTVAGTAWSLSRTPISRWTVSVWIRNEHFKFDVSTVEQRAATWETSKRWL